jgi:hypothetical protein
MTSPDPSPVRKERSLVTPEVFQTVDSIRTAFDRLNMVLNSGQGYIKENNEWGVIAWREAPVLEAYLSMYELTKDARYLDWFTRHADEVAKKRDSVTGRKTYDGKSPPAWPSSGKYTLGVPATVPDAAGHSSLEIRTYGWSDSGSISISIQDGTKPGTYQITAARRSKILGDLTKTYDGLTQQTAERDINYQDVKEQLVRVKVTGGGRPVNTTLPPPATARYVFSVQTGVIASAYARFAALVKSYNLKEYGQKAQEYIRVATDAVATHDDEWKELSNNRGCYVFRRDAPVWSDGVVVPYNYLFAMGRACIFIYLATGDSKTKDRVERTKNFWRQSSCPNGSKEARAACLKTLENGSLVWPYWGEEGYSGWTPEENRSTNTPRRAGQRTMEDVNHGALDYAFFVDATRNGIGLTNGEMTQLAVTVKRNLLARLPDFPKWIDGTGSAGPAYPHLGHYISMADFDPSIARTVRDFVKDPGCETDNSLPALAGIALQLKKSGLI